jgi:hypothetical protein
MVLVDHLKGVKTDDLIADVAFGRHVATGDMTKSILTAQRFSFSTFSATRPAKGWSGVEGLWFRGINRDSTKYKFHPGIMSPSNTDTVQGIDTIFNQDTPHSNLAWIRCECPNGSGNRHSRQRHSKRCRRSGLSGIFKTQLGDIYNSSGCDNVLERFSHKPGRRPCLWLHGDPPICKFSR